MVLGRKSKKQGQKNSIGSNGNAIAVVNIIVDTVIGIIIVGLIGDLLPQRLTPVQRYIQNGDPEFNYPQSADTVSNSSLAFIAGGLPILITLGYTLLQCIFDKLILKQNSHRQVARINFTEWGYILIVLVETLLLTGLFKLWMNLQGRYRPDWFKAFEGSSDPHQVRVGQQSFPSGHASFSFAGMTVLSLYFLGKWRLFSPQRVMYPFLRLFLALFPIYLSTYVAVSRVVDYKHHYSDIITGSFIGLISAYMSYSLNFNSLYSDLSGAPKVLTSGLQQQDFRMRYYEMEENPMQVNKSVSGNQQNNHNDGMNGNTNNVDEPLQQTNKV